ncbi:MAG: YgiT-type zinc finger protein [Deltaproteobacteria bacterium]|jgi:YgiT-type zinc finger domain-containing protein|nr:YgiT-type zinc finger protein [Deltaproteobacteria bacterium]MBT4526375.1 YgiT-type zinc finger protein [Deltaproteobacteria bacterium]
MKCHECGGNYKTTQTNFRIKSKTVGNITVPNIKLEECKKCGNQLLDDVASLKVSEHVRSKETEALGRQPISDFIDAQETVKILEITKQALSKNPRIQRRFILARKLGKYNFYLKDSVLKYKESGDGRILLESGDGKYAIKGETFKLLQSCGNLQKNKILSFARKSKTSGITAGSGSLETPSEELLEN